MSILISFFSSEEEQAAKHEFFLRTYVASFKEPAQKHFQPRLKKKYLRDMWDFDEWTTSKERSGKSFWMDEPTTEKATAR